MLVLALIDEVSRKIYIDFLVFSGLSRCFHDDLVGGGVDVLEIILLMQRVFFLYVDMEVFLRPDHVLSETICMLGVCVLFSNIYPKIESMAKNGLTYAISLVK